MRLLNSWQLLLSSLACLYSHVLSSHHRGMILASLHRAALHSLFTACAEKDWVLAASTRPPGAHFMMQQHAHMQCTADSTSQQSFPVLTTCDPPANLGEVCSCSAHRATRCAAGLQVLWSFQTQGAHLSLAGPHTSCPSPDMA